MVQNLDILCLPFCYIYFQSAEPFLRVLLSDLICHRRTSSLGLIKQTHLPQLHQYPMLDIDDRMISHLPSYSRSIMELVSWYTSVFVRPSKRGQWDEAKALGWTQGQTALSICSKLHSQHQYAMPLTHTAHTHIFCHLRLVQGPSLSTTPALGCKACLCFILTLRENPCLSISAFSTKQKGQACLSSPPPLQPDVATQWNFAK